MDNDKYLLDIETFREVMGKESVTEIKYTGMFVNIELGVMYYYSDEDGFPHANDCINVWELLAKIKEYLLINKGINIVTDYSLEETVEERWTAMAVNRGEVAYSYAFLNETEIFADETADTEYEAVFKIADILLSNKEDE